MTITPTATAPVLSAHPIAPAMREDILATLADIEQRENVTLLFACESGSRGWGFASPDSDYDVRFLYVNRLPWYLTLEPGRDVIERPISGELDVSGWDLRKALVLLRNSNPTLMEWLLSPVVYQQDAAFIDRLTALSTGCFSPVRGYHHYVSMAKKNYREHLRGEEVRYKKYLYVLRPLLAARWIRAGRGMPPMRFAELVQATVTELPLIDEINALLEVKMRAGEAATSPPWKGIQAFIERELEVAERNPVVLDQRAPTAALDALLKDTVLRFDTTPRCTA
jgi:predicted nucleotidyltransferase